MAVRDLAAGNTSKLVAREVVARKLVAREVSTCMQGKGIM